MGRRNCVAALGFLVTLWAVSSHLPQFFDVAAEAGLDDIFYCGSDTSKQFIIEALGGGVALLDYDNDGFQDVFFVTGSRLEGFPPGHEPTNQLYHNNRFYLSLLAFTPPSVFSSGRAERLRRLADLRRLSRRYL